MSEKIWMPVNHNGTELSMSPMTRAEAERELDEYFDVTGNSGTVVRLDDSKLGPPRFVRFTEANGTMSQRWMRPICDEFGRWVAWVMP